ILCRAIQRRNALLRDKGVARCFAIIHGGHKWWGCRLDIDDAFHVTDIVGYAAHEELDSRLGGAITILIAASVHGSVVTIEEFLLVARLLAFVDGYGWRHRARVAIRARAVIGGSL